MQRGLRPCLAARTGLPVRYDRPALAAEHRVDQGLHFALAEVVQRVAVVAVHRRRAQGGGAALLQLQLDLIRAAGLGSSLDCNLTAPREVRLLCLQRRAHHHQGAQLALLRCAVGVAAAGT